MRESKIADTRPAAEDLEAGKTVWWCSCGRSATQPFCDGSHQGTGFDPVEFTPEKTGKYFFCLCKRTGSPPLCDGSHKQITQGDIDAAAGLRTVWYKVAEPHDMREREVRAVQAGTTTLALTFAGGRYGALDNACPHQGGPLGEGTIECDEAGACLLRCPWHGWDFDPLTGKAPGGFEDAVRTFPVEVRDDGIFVAVRERTERQRTVSDVVAETLVNWGVTHVFGMVGHSNLGMADALRVQQEAGRLTYIGIRHEGAASFACSGYAKLTGRPAACLAIAGPGSTNLLTGLWDARMDRAPVIALTGQVNTQVLGPGAFQEIDLAAAFEAVAAFSQTVLSSSRHAELTSLALKRAIVERDVAHLILPDEVQILAVDQGGAAGRPDGRIGNAAIRPPDEDAERAVAMLAAAERPIIVAGYGARDAMGEVVALAERLGAPVLTTFKAKGQIADAHPLAAGVLGRSGLPVASWVMNACDLILVFGASFSDHTGITPKKPIIQVDFDRMNLGKFHAVELPIWGEIGVTAAALRAGLPARVAARDQRAELAERWRQWREEKRKRAGRDRGQGLSAAAVFTILSDTVPADAVLAVDVGNNTYSFGRYFECREQRVLMSGYLGSIGFAFPAALGAWAATRADRAWRGRRVVSVSGDGGFGQYMAEFTTAVKYDMDITHVLLNNNELGKISKEQRAGQWPVWQTDLVNPDFAAYARNCGGLGVRVTTTAELAPALGAALDHAGPALVEVITDAELI
jgi:thiamine pyrophosphate-dependent acetolactate synthase large subunit-like protein/nitrite reductase/ring-hydroxylating ferredoxin subunit/CDGSH-type Zn-finger protein